MLQEIISPWSLSFFKKNSTQNAAMSTCHISAFFLGTSAAQVIAADDLVEQCPGAVPESIYQPDPKTMQQHIEKGGVTSGRGKGKMSGKRVFWNPMLSFYKYNIQAYNSVLFCFVFVFVLTAL